MAAIVAHTTVIPTHPLEEHAWKSDYILPESSQAELRSLLEGLDGVLSQHDAKIAVVQAVLDQLLNERKSQVMRIDKLKSALAPYKKLPPELVARIFKDCSPTLKLPPDIIFDRHNRPHSTISSHTAINSRSILPVMEVCSWWREIALNSRELWDDISIRYPEFQSLSRGAEKYRYLTEKSREIISRGARSITIFISINRSIVLPEVIDPLRNLIIPFSHQITEINLMSSMHYLFDFLRSSSPSFPVLKSLTLKTEGSRMLNQPEYELSSDLDVFKHAPMLQVFKMDGFSLNLATLASGLSKIHLRWDRLTRIDFRNTQLNISSAHWLFSQCPSAISCWLSLSSITHIVPLTTIIQTNLQSLSITSTSEGQSATVLVFQSLTLPSLRSFEITDSRFKDSLTEFLSLVSRSHCTLINLSILEAQIPAMLLDPLLKLLPALEDLNIPRAIIPIPTLERISQGVLLPRLTKIICSIQSSPSSLQSFMDAVERTEAQDTTVPRLRIAIAVLPEKEGHYTAARWPQVIQRFKKIAEKLRQEGRLISLPEFRGLWFGSSTVYKIT
ncbi:hypothetical protein C0993_012136 [Termitomyces sp. T159_Od127]|nr:hypothetical protein C0993_012136 [Termitomyces sp. T159_Od127]